MHDQSLSEDILLVFKISNVWSSSGIRKEFFNNCHRMVIEKEMLWLYKAGLLKRKRTNPKGAYIYYTDGDCGGLASIDPVEQDDSHPFKPVPLIDETASYTAFGHIIEAINKSTLIGFSVVFLFIFTPWISWFLDLFYEGTPWEL